MSRLESIVEILDHYFTDYCEKTQLIAAKRILDIVEQDRWVSVDDRLPDDETPVLAIVDGFDYPLILEIRTEVCNEMIEGYFKDFRYWDQPSNDGQEYNDLVKAWQPLPNPPHEWRVNDDR